MTLKEWLDTPCCEDEINYIEDGDKRIAYIPIGIIEKILDEAPEALLFTWGTENWKFQITKTGTHWFATGSILLSIAWSENEVDFTRAMQGAATIRISSRDENMHYEATVLSLAISNAASRLGRRFGRHLNDRMVTGETSFREDNTPETVDRAENRWKDLIDDCKTLEELGAIKARNKNMPESVTEYYNQKCKNLFNNGK